MILSRILENNKKSRGKNVRYEILKYNRIRDLRVDKDYTQKFVVRHLNIAQNTLSQYELGERSIPPEILIELALFYDVSVDYLLGLTNEKAPYPRK